MMSQLNAKIHGSYNTVNAVLIDGNSCHGKVVETELNINDSLELMAKAYCCKF